MESILFIVILILSIIAHEVAHGYAANALGDPTARLAGRLTLNPLPHIDLMGSIILPVILIFTNSPLQFGWAKPVPYNPYNLKPQRLGEFLVAMAGVIMNIFLAVIFGLMVRFSTELGLSGGAVIMAATISFTNLFLGLFNLIPFPPLDGFTALRTALPWHLSLHMNRFEQKVRASGIFSLILFLIFFSYIFSSPFVHFTKWLFTLLTGSRI